MCRLSKNKVEMLDIRLKSYFRLTAKNLLIVYYLFIVQKRYTRHAMEDLKVIVIVQWEK